ncbi:MAG: hypothetical protein ABIW31_07735 [Novosphingobium sp.]
MDSYRGEFGEYQGLSSGGYDPAEDEIGHEAPPPAIGADERRMQVRAYNHWASLLKTRDFPTIADLATGSLPDFDPYSVLLDFSAGVKNPAIRYLGAKLAAECGVNAEAIRTLDDVPSRSLLSRITDHYLQIHANKGPIGFEAEFVSQAGSTIAYRGILLPFSGHAESAEIEQIYGVINWKELADQQTTDALLGEIDRALESFAPREALPMAEWADGPADDGGDVLDLVTPFEDGDGGTDWPSPEFGHVEGDDEKSLADWLASARELAQAAQGSEDRTRQALYAAIGRAWDFALAAHDHLEQFNAIVAAAGLTMQDRAPFTPVVKLVFGANHDKTRLTEYASAMAHAHRHGIGRGDLARFLSHAPGGLKGVVNAERRLRREDSGKTLGLRDSPQEAMAKRLREIDVCPLAELSAEGDEFAVVVVRRTAQGEVVLVGEVFDDPGLLERAAKRLLS